MDIIVMYNFRKVIVLFLLTCSLLVVSAPIKVILPQEATEYEKNAAKDLLKYVNRCAPAGLTLKGKKGVTFHVGNTEFAKKNSIDASLLADDVYVLRTIGNNVVLLGGGTRGTEYAVYKFLEKYLKIRWYSMDVEKVPVHNNVVDLPEIKQKVIPAFKLREIYPSNWRSTRDGGLFAIRNRLNAWGQRGIKKNFGGAMRFGSPDSSHTFECYFPAKKYIQKHPEYFSLIDNKRVGGQFTGQLCLTNSEMTKAFIEKLKAYIIKDEEKARINNTLPPRMYDISQNDNSFICQCPKCSKIIEKEGAQAGLIIYFVNKIAEAIKDFRPDIYITTLAYGITEKAPKYIRAKDNVIVRLTNTASNKVGSILDIEQRPYRKRVKFWKGAAGIYIWEYPTNYGLLVPPYPNEFFFGDMFKFYSRNKVDMLFLEFSAAPRDDMPEMKMYIAAKLMENPYQDVNLLMNDFLKGFYGAAGKSIKAYRKLLFDSVTSKKNYVYCSIESYTFLDLKTILKAYELLNKAEKEVANSRNLLERVKRVRYNLDLAAFVLFRRLTGEFLKNGGRIKDFPLSQDKLLKDIKATWKLINDKLVCKKLQKDQLKLLKQFTAKYAGHPDVTALPDDFSKFSNKVIDITIDLAKIHSLKLCKDPESKVGYAVFVDLKHFGKSGAVPLIFGAYNEIKAKRLGKKGAIDPRVIPKAGYNYYYCMTLKPEFSSYVYFLDNWYIQFALDSAAAKNPGIEYDVYISAKFSGKPYKFSSSKSPYGIYIDRCLLVPKK